PPLAAGTARATPAGKPGRDPRRATRAGGVAAGTHPPHPPLERQVLPRRKDQQGVSGRPANHTSRTCDEDVPTSRHRATAASAWRATTSSTRIRYLPVRSGSCRYTTYPSITLSSPVSSPVSSPSTTYT